MNFFLTMTDILSQNIHLSSWIINLSTCVQFFNPCLPCRCQNVAISHSIFALVCLKSTVFASCGVLAQLMDGCGHERIVCRRCQILGEYWAMSLCQLSGLPSRILVVEYGLALCGNMVVHHLEKIVVWSWWVHVRFVVDTVELRWVFFSKGGPPYLRVVRSKTYCSYMTPQMIPKAICSVI
jgi:hypothetical protein